METVKRASVRTDQLEPGMVILAVEGKFHDPCWREIHAVYRRDIPFGDKPGMTEERWQIWFADTEYPVGLISYGDSREWKVGTREDLGTEVPR